MSYEVVYVDEKGEEQKEFVKDTMDAIRRKEQLEAQGTPAKVVVL